MLKANSETLIQIEVVNYLRRNHPNILFTSGFLGMGLSKQTLSKLMAMGYRAGTPDLLILEPQYPYHGLFLELKRSDSAFDEEGRTKKFSAGRLSDEQKIFQAELQARRYKVYTCFGTGDALAAIERYFWGKPKGAKPC